MGSADHDAGFEHLLPRNVSANRASGTLTEMKFASNARGSQRHLSMLAAICVTRAEAPNIEFAQASGCRHGHPAPGHGVPEIA